MEQSPVDGQVEELGFVPLPDKREAVAFGATVVRDLVAERPDAGLVEAELRAAVLEVVPESARK